MKFVNDLPDDCLRLIFLRVPLSDRIYLHRVCPRWRSLQSSVTSCIKTLTLRVEATKKHYDDADYENFLTIPYLGRIDESSALLPFVSAHTLTFPSLTANITTQLATLLPNIESLQLKCRTFDLNLFNQLLEGWSGQLVKYEFNCWEYDCIVDHNSKSRDKSRCKREEHAWVCCADVFAMFDILNEKCLQLKHLTISISKDLLWSNPDFVQIFEIRPLDLTCLARIKTFRFSSDDLIDCLLASLSRHALGNAQLTQIVIATGTDDEGEYNLLRFFSAYPTIMKKICALPILDESILLTNLSKWTNLTYFSLNTEILFRYNADLAKLANLVHLELKIKESSLEQYEQTPSYSYDQLLSVKILSIRTEEHIKLNSKHWEWLFPKVQLLKLCHFNKCNIERAEAAAREKAVDDGVEEDMREESDEGEQEKVVEDEQEEEEMLEEVDDDEEDDEEVVYEKKQDKEIRILKEQLQTLKQCSSLKHVIFDGYQEFEWTINDF